jgi:acetylornithine/succinyldiaminopimelate/putrescine aminotransferase
MNTLTNTSNKVWNSTEERALKLLGSGCGPEVVATAVGVTVSRISQLLSEPEFAAAVSDLRFQSLQKHNEMDNKYDSMEEKLLRQLDDLLPLMMRPMEILKAIQVINAAKRRGQSAPESITHQNTVVNLVMPTQIIQKFTTNINNQVTNAGSQTLETMQSSTLLNAAKKRAEQLAGELNGSNNSSNTVLIGS